MQKTAEELIPGVGVRKRMSQRWAAACRIVKNNPQAGATWGKTIKLKYLFKMTKHDLCNVGNDTVLTGGLEQKPDGDKNTSLLTLSEENKSNKGFSKLSSDRTAPICIHSSDVTRPTKTHSCGNYITVTMTAEGRVWRRRICLQNVAVGQSKLVEYNLNLTAGKRWTTQIQN